MKGTGPFLLNITPYKIIHEYVVFEAHMIPCPVFEDTHGNSSITVNIIDLKNKKSMWWIKDAKTIQRKGSSMNWEQEFNDFDKIKDKGYFIVPLSQKNGIKANVILNGYTCLNDMPLDTFNPKSYMLKESGIYFYSNGIIVNWKHKPDVISIKPSQSMVKNEGIRIIRDAGPAIVDKDFPKKRKTIDYRKNK